MFDKNRVEDNEKLAEETSAAEISEEPGPDDEVGGGSGSADNETTVQLSHISSSNLPLNSNTTTSNNETAEFAPTKAGFIFVRTIFCP